ncbi:hypothetical protein EDB86DRAFT_3183382 [Lactarius hatsudake]|nr:hypothetical protein EDB86DRAFT_3183382 [Lactarius hatsudake]
MRIVTELAGEAEVLEGSSHRSCSWAVQLAGLIRGLVPDRPVRELPGDITRAEFTGALLAVPDRVEDRIRPSVVLGGSRERRGCLWSDDKDRAGVVKANCTPKSVPSDGMYGIPIAGNSYGLLGGTFNQTASSWEIMVNRRREKPSLRWSLVVGLKEDWGNVLVSTSCSDAHGRTMPRSVPSLQAPSSCEEVQSLVGHQVKSRYPHKDVGVSSSSGMRLGTPQQPMCAFLSEYEAKKLIEMKFPWGVSSVRVGTTIVDLQWPLDWTTAGVKLSLAVTGTMHCLTKVSSRWGLFRCDENKLPGKYSSHGNSVGGEWRALIETEGRHGSEKGPRRLEALSLEITARECRPSLPSQSMTLMHVYMSMAAASTHHHCHPIMAPAALCSSPYRYCFTARKLVAAASTLHFMGVRHRRHPVTARKTHHDPTSRFHHNTATTLQHRLNTVRKSCHDKSQMTTTVRPLRRGQQDVDDSNHNCDEATTTATTTM